MTKSGKVVWRDGGGVWVSERNQAKEFQEFKEGILREKQSVPQEPNKAKSGKVKSGKLFSQKGFFGEVKTLLVNRELSDREKKQINDAVKVETSKFPHMKIVTLVGEDQKGKIYWEFVHKTRPKRTPVDQINDLIASEKEKIKRRR